MRAVLTQVRAALRRRRTQTAVVFIVSLMAAGISTMALTLLVRSNQPWDDAFARLNGPHLLFDLDANRVTPTQLDATTHLPGVTAAGPPTRTANVPFGLGGKKGLVQVIERADPGGSVHRLALGAGRWPADAGEIAVIHGSQGDYPILPALGDTMHSVNTHPVEFKVVGEVVDLTPNLNRAGTLRGWVIPGQLTQLVDGAQVRLGYQMPYRFEHAATDADLAADRRVVEAALPAGAETQAPGDWISARSGSNWLVAAVSSVVFAFSVFALLAVTLIVASVVAGSVVSSYREIGIIKALGFTPAQVVGIIVLQMAVPAVIGALVGVPLGSLFSRPFLEQPSASLHLPAASAVDPLVDVMVPIGLLLLVVLAALVPALRAARLNSIRAIARGSSPQTARPSRLGAILTRLGTPRPLSLGAGEAFARPVRGLLTVLALAIGIATLVFAFAFTPTIKAVGDDLGSWGAAGDVHFARYPALVDPAATALINAQPETKVVVATSQLPLTLSGHAETEPLTGMRGDAAALGYHAASGRWFAAPGEAVVASLTARDRHIKIGDSIDATVNGAPLRLHVVGVNNDIITGGRGFTVGWQTLAGAVPTAAPDIYLVNLLPGADKTSYGKRISAAGGEGIAVQEQPWAQYLDGFYTLLNALVGSLALVLAAIAAVGVFNATLLSTRERVHDIAVLKALGMTPAQIAVMAAASALVMAAVAAVIGIPAGIWLVGMVVGAMGDLYGFVGNGSAAIGPLSAVLIVASVFVVALAGAALPARWAARTPVTQVLRSE
jgi:putative ABC transport system permease protein